MPDFLLEVGCEEIPARMIEAGATEFAYNIILGVQQPPPYPQIENTSIWWTPRRLAICLHDLPVREPDVECNEVGPSWNVAFKNGEPTAAAQAFAKKHSVAVSDLRRITTPKGDYVGVQVVRQGRATVVVVKDVVETELKNISWPKTMYWRGKTSERFVRPVRWIVALFGQEVVPVEFAGVVASRTSRGHRLLGQGQVKIEQPDTYVETLCSFGVILNPFEREQVIRKALDSATRTIPGARWRDDDGLLATVVNLTEFPSAILGSFDPEFLELPEEVLVTVMRDHQKYFAIEDAAGKLLPHFLAVLNTAGDSQGLIRHGNERVLRARFNDARFFWQTDQKQTLRQRVELLKHVTFHKDLGSYYDKTIRVRRLASWLCEIVKQGGVAVRPGVVHKAACLAKTDLTTELVKEFTELQGIVGGLYARVQPLDDDLKPEVQAEIAKAIYDHYKPESMEDDVPRTIEGAVLSIADKADTIAGMFALGLWPTGSKDPFALRRQANAIVRIVGEKRMRVSLTEVLSSAATGFGTKEQQEIVRAKLHNILRPLNASGVFVSSKDVPENEVTGPPSSLAYNLGTFFRERLQFYLREYLHFRFDIVSAVTAASSDDVLSAVQRSEAIAATVNKTEFTSIAVAFKRMHNIIRQAKEKSFQVADSIRPDLFSDVERDLYREMQPIGTAFMQAVQHHNYLEALNALVALAPRIDAFFEHVMVMVDDSDIRANRLLLLNSLGRGFSGIAHFDQIVTEGKESTK